MAELQQPNIVGNFLSAYGAAQAQQQAQQDREFNKQRVMRQDDMAEQQFGMQKQAQQFKLAEEVVNMLGSVQDGDAAGFERAKQRWGQMGLPPEAVAGYTVADLPMLRMKAGTQLRELQAQQVRAQTAAANRSNRPDASGGQGNAPSGYQWVRGQDGSVALAPIKGGPADTSTAKMNDEQAKALGFAKRVEDANKLLEDPGYQSSLLSGKENVMASVPLVGNSLTSSSYQMADQAVRDFINAQLRRESGAVIADSEFDNARRQYIPVYGDRPEVLERKRLARQRALENLYVSSGPRGYQAAQEVAPTAAPPQPAAAANVPPPPPGFVVSK